MILSAASFSPRLVAASGWFGVLLIVGLPVAVLLGVVLGPLAWWIAYGVFWMLIGYVILSSRGTPVTRTTE